jgi:hypothetical protein
VADERSFRVEAKEATLSRDEWTADEVEVKKLERMTVRNHWLANSVFASLADIMDACEMAWNRFATNHGLVRSLCAVAWAPASPAL